MTAIQERLSSVQRAAADTAGAIIGTELAIAGKGLEITRGAIDLTHNIGKVTLSGNLPAATLQIVESIRMVDL